MISTIPLDYILQLIYGSVDPKGKFEKKDPFRWFQVAILEPVAPSQWQLLDLISSSSHLE